jgi:hypothetical protein
MLCEAAYYSDVQNNYNTSNINLNDSITKIVVSADADSTTNGKYLQDINETSPSSNLSSSQFQRVSSTFSSSSPLSNGQEMTCTVKLIKNPTSKAHKLLKKEKLKRKNSKMNKLAAANSNNILTISSKLASIKGKKLKQNGLAQPECKSTEINLNKRMSYIKLASTSESPSFVPDIITLNEVDHLGHNHHLHIDQSHHHHHHHHHHQQHYQHHYQQNLNYASAMSILHDDSIQGYDKENLYYSRQSDQHPLNGESSSSSSLSTTINSSYSSSSSVNDYFQSCVSTSRDTSSTSASSSTNPTTNSNNMLITYTCESDTYPVSTYYTFAGMAAQQQQQQLPPPPHHHNGNYQMSESASALLATENPNLSGTGSYSNEYSACTSPIGPFISSNHGSSNSSGYNSLSCYAQKQQQQQQPSLHDYQYYSKLENYYQNQNYCLAASACASGVSASYGMTNENGLSNLSAPVDTSARYQTLSSSYFLNQNNATINATPYLCVSTGTSSNGIDECLMFKDTLGETFYQYHPSSGDKYLHLSEEGESFCSVPIMLPEPIIANKKSKLTNINMSSKKTRTNNKSNAKNAAQAQQHTKNGMQNANSGNSLMASGCSNINSVSSSKRKRKRILNRLQRAEATLREKRRMLKLNKAFEELRKVLPISEFAKNKLSRAETLKSAIEYIDKMSQLLTI